MDKSCPVVVLGNSKKMCRALSYWFCLCVCACALNNCNLPTSLPLNFIQAVPRNLRCHGSSETSMVSMGIKFSGRYKKPLLDNITNLFATMKCVSNSFSGFWLWFHEKRRGRVETCTQLKKYVMNIHGADRLWRKYMHSPRYQWDLRIFANLTFQYRWLRQQLLLKRRLHHRPPRKRTNASLSCGYSKDLKRRCNLGFL